MRRFGFEHCRFWAQVALTSVLWFGLSLLNDPSMALASSKAVTPEALDMAINEAAQEFVESVMDEYADILEEAFDTAYDPLKSSVKSVSKQLAKAEKAATKEGDAAAETITQAPFQSAADSFETLQATTAGFKAQLEAAPNVVEEMLEAQIGTKMAALEQAIAEAKTAVDQIVADVTSLEAADPATTTAFSEHTTALTQAVEAVDLAIDDFDS